jgi:lipoprotein-anchoring transpeptidase ErfK/SrfK
MSASRFARFVLAAAVVLALAAVPGVAMAAVHTGPVPSPAVVGGVNLLGLSDAEARTAIVAALPVPAMAPLDVTCLTAVRTVDPTPAVAVDVEAILDEAYASTATDPYVIAAKYRVDHAVVLSWIAPFSAGIDAPATDARYIVMRRRLSVVASVAGRRVDVAAAEAAITAAVLAEAEAGGAAQPAVMFGVVPVAPRVHESAIPRALLVVLGETRLYSYRVGGSLEKVYRCAVGMSRYPTPRGTFKVIGKRVNPSWSNPGSKWARSMPRYIRPGPNNPLGTRALYLNASGIRIHGTSQFRSIGRAASHGCVRLVRKDIEGLYPKIPVGTTVFIVR